MRAVAPGKIILSGEHSVVYGAPAIATAVNLHSCVEWRKQQQKALLVDMSPLHPLTKHRVESLLHLPEQLDRRYRKFEQGITAITQVLQSPDQLGLYVLASMLSACELGASVKIRSQLPLGAGMGSSASVIAALLVLCETINGDKLSLQARYQQVRYCERLQHGKGSLIDAATVVLGGAVSLIEQRVCSLSLRLTGDWYWLFSGTPQSTTGECVSLVGERFKSDQQLWQTFAQCTELLQSQLALSGDPSEALRQNQHLLEYIQVVPERVRQLVKQLNARGVAAKVSGAGAIKGSDAGLVIAYAPAGVEIEPFLNTLNLPWGKIEQDIHGARVEL